MLTTHFYRNRIHNFLNSGLVNDGGMGTCRKQAAGMHIIQFLFNEIGRAHV